MVRLGNGMVLSPETQDKMIDMAGATPTERSTMERRTVSGKETRLKRILLDLVEAGAADKPVHYKDLNCVKTGAETGGYAATVMGQWLRLGFLTRPSSGSYQFTDKGLDMMTQRDAATLAKFMNPWKKYQPKKAVRTKAPVTTDNGTLTLTKVGKLSDGTWVYADDDYRMYRLEQV